MNGPGVRVGTHPCAKNADSVSPEYLAFHDASSFTWLLEQCKTMMSNVSGQEGEPRKYLLQKEKIFGKIA